MDDIWVMENAGYRIDWKTKTPVIMLFSRNYRKKFETITHEVKGFRPYFYCPSDETDVKLPYGCEYGETVIDALGREVTKVLVDIPKRVAEIRDNYSFTDMSDFLFEKRFLVDYKIKYAYTWDGVLPHPIEVDAILEPRILFYDIENLSMDGGFPEAMDAEYPTCMIQVLDSYTDKHLLLTSGVPQTDFEGHIACKNEHRLFALFMEYIKEINPDVITGWYSSGYDLPYLIKRSQNLGSNVNGFARYSGPFRNHDPKDNKWPWSCKAPGRSILDMRRAFEKKTAVEAERESYALKSISAGYGFEYEDYGPTIGKLFEKEDWKTLLQYGLNDVLALKLINEKAGLFTFFESLRKFTGCFLDDVIHTSIPIESILLHGGIRPMPRKSAYVSSGEKYEGALVHENPVGIHHDVMTIDIAALYPNIFYGYNLSPDIDGLVATILKNIMNERERLRALRKAHPDNLNYYYEESSVKVIANGMYGTIGSKAFRLYNEKIASEITRRGRELNLMLKNEAEKMGLFAIGGDTDSLFLKGAHSVEEGLEYEKKFNEILAKFSKDTNSRVVFTLKFEKYFKTLLFKFSKKGDKAAKKNYIGNIIWKEDKGFIDDLHDTGTELTRSDSSKITKEILTTFMDYVLMKDDMDSAKKYIKEMYDKVKRGEVSYYDVSLPKEVRTVAKATDKHSSTWKWQVGKQNTATYLHQYIGEGTKPRLLYLTREPRVLCIDEDTDIGEWVNYIDWTEMLDKTVTSKLQSYVRAAGINWDEIIHGQCTLSNWF